MLLHLFPTGWEVRRVPEAPPGPARAQQGRLQGLHERSGGEVLQKWADDHGSPEAVADAAEEPGGRFLHFPVNPLPVGWWAGVDAHSPWTGFSVCLRQVHAAAADEAADALDDVENSLLYYNQAIVHYYLRQFSEAVSIGERLYQFLEPFGTRGRR